MKLSVIVHIQDLSILDMAVKTIETTILNKPNLNAEVTIEVG